MPHLLYCSAGSGGPSHLPGIYTLLYSKQACPHWRLREREVSLLQLYPSFTIWGSFIPSLLWVLPPSPGKGPCTSTTSLCYLLEIRHQDLVHIEVKQENWGWEMRLHKSLRRPGQCHMVKYKTGNSCPIQESDFGKVSVYLWLSPSQWNVSTTDGCWFQASPMKFPSWSQLLCLLEADGEEAQGNRKGSGRRNINPWISTWRRATCQPGTSALYCCMSKKTLVLWWSYYTFGHICYSRYKNILTNAVKSWSRYNFSQHP